MYEPSEGTEDVTLGAAVSQVEKAMDEMELLLSEWKHEIGDAECMSKEAPLLPNPITASANRLFIVRDRIVQMNRNLMNEVYNRT